MGINSRLIATWYKTPIGDLRLAKERQDNVSRRKGA
jgi:hypothetical protein